MVCTATCVQDLVELAHRITDQDGSEQVTHALVYAARVYFNNFAALDEVRRGQPPSEVLVSTWTRGIVEVGMICMAVPRSVESL